MSAVVPVSPRAMLSDNRGAAAFAVAPVRAAEDDAASAAEFARVHARIADIMADMRSEANAPSVDGAAADIQAMMPAPVIMVPLPPATKEAVEFAARLAKKIAQQTLYAHAAHVHIKRAAVDQLLSTAS